MIVALLFTITKMWKQPKCLSTDEWIKKIQYIYTPWNTTQPLKNGNNAICPNIDGPRDYLGLSLSEVSQTE